MKNKIVFFIVFFSFNLQSHANIIPQSWILGSKLSSSGEKSISKDDDIEPLKKEWEKILNVQEKGIHAFASNPLREGIEKSLSRWELKEINTLVGISHGGQIGLLGLSGEAGVELYWRRKNYTKSISDKRERPTLKISRFTDNMALDEKVKALTQTLILTGKIKNKEKLRRNLKKSLQLFKSTLTAIKLPHRRRNWELSAIQANFAVEASGNISTVSVGAVVEITFEWAIEYPIKEKELSFDSSKEKNPLEKKMEKLFQDISLDVMDAVENEKMIPQMQANVFEIGLAVGVGGEIGVASVAGSAGFTLVFERNDMQEKLISEPTPSYLMKGNIFIAGWGDTYEKGLNDWDIKKLKFKKITREKFRKGISKSFRMGRFFAKRIIMREKRKIRRGRPVHWTISRMKVASEMNLEGSVGVLTISGTPAIEIGFENKNF